MNIDIKILEKVSELFMRYGIKSISMDDVSRHLGMSKKTLYQIIDSKDALISKVVQQHLINEKREIEAICNESVDSIHQMVMIGRLISKKLRETNPSVVYDLQKYYRASWTQFESLHQDHIYEIIKNNITEGIDTGIYRDNIRPEIIAKFYVAKSFVLVDEKVFPMGEYKREELFLEFITYHIHGIASQKGLELLEKHLTEKEDK